MYEEKQRCPSFSINQLHIQVRRRFSYQVAGNGLDPCEFISFEKFTFIAKEVSLSLSYSFLFQLLGLTCRIIYILYICRCVEYLFQITLKKT